MAVALLTTMYGAILANVFCLPIAQKLENAAELEAANNELIIEGVLFIQAGGNPRILTDYLASFLSPKVREKGCRSCRLRNKQKWLKKPRIISTMNLPLLRTRDWKTQQTKKTKIKRLNRGKKKMPTVRVHRIAVRLKKIVRHAKGGAPAWMANFADMATLLMAFFVLLLSFAETELPKFKMISGALKNAFGVKVIVPLITIPMARSIVAQEFTPSVAEPTVIPSKKQKSEDTSRKNIVKKTEENEGESSVDKDFREVQEALAEEINSGQAKIRIKDEKIVVDLQNKETSGGKSSKDLSRKSGGKISQETLDIASKITEIQTKVPSEILVRRQPKAIGEEQKGRSEGELDGKSAAGLYEQDRIDQKNKYKQLRMELSEQISKGLADVLLDGDNIIVRLANQGSFVSGSADLRTSFGIL